MNQSEKIPEIRILDPAKLGELLRSSLRSAASNSKITLSGTIFAQNGALLSMYQTDQNGTLVQKADSVHHPSKRVLRTSAATWASAWSAMQRSNGATRRDNEISSSNIEYDSAHSESVPSLASSSIIYESLSSHTFTVITQIAEKVLLAVTASTPQDSVNAQIYIESSHDEQDSAQTDYVPSSPSSSSSSPSTAQTKASLFPQETINMLESTSQELASILCEELEGLQWPPDL